MADLLSLAGMPIQQSKPRTKSRQTQAKQAGVIAMKVYAQGEIRQHELALRYALSLPGVSTAIVGMAEESEIDENVRLAEAITPLSEREQEALLEEAKRLLVGDEPSDRSPVFWVYDTKTMAWKERSEPELVRY